MVRKMKRRKQSKKKYVESTQSINCQRLTLTERIECNIESGCRQWKKETWEQESNENKKNNVAGIAFVHANNNYITSFELHRKCGFFDTTDIYARLPHRAFDGDYVLNRKRLDAKRQKFNIIDLDFGVYVCVFELLAEPFVLIRPIQ